MAEIPITLGRPIVNTTMTLDNTPSQRESITPCPPLSPRSTMPQRLAVIDMVDAHHSLAAHRRMAVN
jgi:hypothetical protein